MSSRQRSRGQVQARLRAAGPAITPALPEPDFADSEIDVLPLEMKRDAVKHYIITLQRDNQTMRQILTDMGKPLTPTGIKHPAKKGKL